MLQKFIAPVVLSGALLGSIAAGGVAAASTPSSSGAVIVVGSSSGQHAARAWLSAHQKALHARALAVSAATLGMTQKALLTELRTGKSITQVARERGVSTQKLLAALTAASKARVKGAVARHRLNRKQAQRVDALLPAYLNKLITRVY